MSDRLQKLVHEFCAGLILLLVAALSVCFLVTDNEFMYYTSDATLNFGTRNEQLVASSIFTAVVMGFAGLFLLGTSLKDFFWDKKSK